MRLYAPPTPKSRRGGLLGLGQGCHHLPATSQSVGKGDIQQHLSSLDTTSTLVSNTLASRAEPPPSRWTNITLEKTYKYWNSWQSYKANILTIASSRRSCNASMNDNATRSRSIYPITQNILQADIGNHSLILLQTTEYYKRELEMNSYQNSRATPGTRWLLGFS